MTPKEIILAQINHEETSPVPFALPVDGEPAEDLNKYYRGTQWQEKIPPYFVNVWAVDSNPHKQIDNVYSRDAYGGIWRNDKLPMHLEKPPISESSFENYSFPNSEKFVVLC